MGILYSKDRLLSTVASVDRKSGFNFSFRSFVFVAFIALVVMGVFLS